MGKLVFMESSPLSSTFHLFSCNSNKKNSIGRSPSGDTSTTETTETVLWSQSTVPHQSRDTTQQLRPTINILAASPACKQDHRQVQRCSRQQLMFKTTSGKGIHPAVLSYIRVLPAPPRQRTARSTNPWHYLQVWRLSGVWPDLWTVRPLKRVMT